MSKRPKSQRRAFPLSFLSSTALGQVLLALSLRGLERTRLRRKWTSLLRDTPRSSDVDGGVDAVVAPVEGVRGDNGLRDAAGDAARVPRGPGRIRNVPARAAGVVGAPPAAGVVDPRPLARRAPRAAAALHVCAVEAPRGRAFTTPINRGRKRHADDDDEGGMSASNIMGMMMMQQRSEQSSRDADRTAREAELALRREEITMRGEEMAMQGEDSRAHQQMMNVMLMAMMQNAGGSNHQQQRMDIGGSNQQQRTDSGTNEQQNNGNNE